MKEAAQAKNAELVKELESLRVQFSDLQVSNNQLSQQVSTLHAQVTVEERIKSPLKSSRNTRKTGHGLRLAVMKCAEPTELRQVFADVVSAGITKGFEVSSSQSAGEVEGCPSIDLIMASLYLESDSGEDAPQWIHELCPSSS
ncbi:hypothetical protein Tco_1325935 [Tanacetum coccineum]